MQQKPTQLREILPHLLSHPHIHAIHTRASLTHLMPPHGLCIHRVEMGVKFPGAPDYSGMETTGRAIEV